MALNEKSPATLGLGFPDLYFNFSNSGEMSGQVLRALP
jgi:hypothetical protein